MKKSPAFSPRTTRSALLRHSDHPVPPDPNEVAQLARTVWLKEGGRPGLEPEYRREVAFQLRLTRHLLAREINARHGCAPPGWVMT